MATIQEYLSELDNQRDILANTLTEKGVESSEDEKFNSLVAKVATLTSPSVAVYKPCGSSATIPTLSTQSEGNLYEISNSFTTTVDFTEGAGNTYPSGTNIVCIIANGLKMWSVMSGMFDMSLYATNADVNEIKETLDDVTDITGISADLSSNVVWKSDGFINTINGLYQKTTSQNYCDYLDISGGYNKLTYDKVLSTNTDANGINYGLVFYDIDKNYISGDRAQNKQPTASYTSCTIDIPDNAVYIRTAMWKEYCDDFKIVVFKEGKFENLETKVEALNKYKPYQSGQIHFTVDAIKSINPLISGEDSTTTADTCLDTTVTQTMNAVLSLPPNYQQIGKPSPVIMFCHGWGGTVHDTTWCDDNADFLSLVDYLNNHGYAVFDVDATDGVNHSPNPDLGCPQLVNAYIKAYEYIKTNYNVESDLSVYACSFGSFTAMNVLQLHGNIVKSAIISGVRQSLAYIHDGWIKFRPSIATKYGFDDETGATYEADKMTPYDTYANIITINDTDYLLKKYPPIKFVFGQRSLDNMCWEQSWRVINALKNSGNVVYARSVVGADHNHVCYAVSDGLKEEVVSWFDRFN